MRAGLFCVLSALLASCNNVEPAPNTPDTALRPSEPKSSPVTHKKVNVTQSWELMSSGEGVALVLQTTDQKAVVRLFCPSGGNMLKVNVQGFRAISSEERLTLGSDSAVVTLVAVPKMDPLLGGVSGAGEIPDELAGLIDGRISVSYGAQNSGPHIAPPKILAKAFVGACNDRQISTEGTRKSIKADNACLVQDGKSLRIMPRRAIGTEPFWSAQTEGRCVQYAHIEDQAGKRIWTRYIRNSSEEIWSGTLNGSPFELRLRNAPMCSDGMSEKRYHFSVELKLGSELRRGCADLS